MPRGNRRISPDNGVPSGAGHQEGNRMNMSDPDLRTVSSHHARALHDARCARIEIYRAAFGAQELFGIDNDSGAIAAQ